MTDWLSFARQKLLRVLSKSFVWAFMKITKNFLK